VTTEAPDFTFDESTHTYKAGSTIYPSVTQIIRAAGMMPWLDYMERQEPFVLENARERGTNVHTVVSLINLGKDWTKSDAFNQLQWCGEEGYINGYLEWLEDSKFEVNPKSVEKRFFNRNRGYAGTIDFWGLEDPASIEATVVDLKSGGFEPAARLQLSAYQNHSDGTLHGQLIKRRIVLCLRRDGTYRAHPLRTSENSLDWNAFQSCLNCWNYKAKHNLITKERKAA